ncbi:MAG: transposase [Phormidium tanganyikae FI6-MK23]|nr:transposase [Phormidium tanganyikae FI6-MK23]
MQHWLDATYPAVVARAEPEAAEIAWGDESGLRSGAQVGQGYAPKGETPDRINFIASVSNQGLVRFMLYAGKLNTLVFITFLERLLKHNRASCIRLWTTIPCIMPKRLSSGYLSINLRLSGCFCPRTHRS